MKCRKCGAEISENAKFCEMCGVRVEEEVTETPVAEEAVAAETVTETVEAAATEEASVAAGDKAFSPIPEEPVKKKVPVWAMVTAGVVGVVAILAILACCSKVVGNTFRKWFLSPEKYLAYVLKENFGESIDDSLTVYDNYISRAQNPDNVDGNVKFEIALGDEFSDYIAEYAGSLTPDAEWVTWVKKATIEYGINSFNDEHGFRAKIGANDVDLVSLTAYASPDGDIYFRVPELLTKTVYVKVEPETYEEILKVKDMFNSIYRELPTKPELQNISKKYLKAIFNNIDGVKRSSEVLTVEDISAKATVLTMELDDVILTNIEIDVLEEFLKDEEFEKIWMRVYDAYEEVVADSGNAIPDKAESYEEIKKNAQKALDEAKEKLELYKKGELENKVNSTFKFYVDNKGSLSGCCIFDEEAEISYIQPSKAGRFGVEFSAKGFDDVDFESMSIVGTGKESASVVTADLTAFVDGEKLFDVVINNLDKSISQKGEGSFDVAVTNINFDEASESDLEVIREIIGDTNIGLYYKGTVSKDTSNATFALGNGDKDIFSVTAITEIKDGSAVTIEGKDDAIKFDINDEEVLIDLIKAIDGDTFAKSLKEAGANEDLVATVEEGIAYIKSLAEYY